MPRKTSIARASLCQSWAMSADHHRGALRPLARRLVGDVPVLELATGSALKDVHVAGFFKLADAPRDEPRFPPAAACAAIPGFMPLVVHEASLVIRLTDFCPKHHTERLCGMMVAQKMTYPPASHGCACTRSFPDAKGLRHGSRQ